MAMRDLVLALAVAAALPATAAAEESAPLAHWSEDHPAASQAFEDWVRQFPNAAHRVFVWDRHHPVRAQAFVQWCAASPAQPLSAFTSSHPDWPVDEAIFKPLRPAIEAFVGWAQAHPSAAQELVTEPRGLAYAGFHLFRADWEQAITPNSAGATLPAASQGAR